MFSRNIANSAIRGVNNRCGINMVSRSCDRLYSFVSKKNTLMGNTNKTGSMCYRWCLQENRLRTWKLCSAYRSTERRSNSYDSSAWACRLANENGYLSWCRNSYLMTGVGVGMLYKGQTQMAELSGYGAIFLAAVSVSWGTYMFIYNLIFLRQSVNMSRWFVLLQSTAAIFHCFGYIIVLIVFAEESEKVLTKKREKQGFISDADD